MYESFWIPAALSMRPCGQQDSNLG